MTNLASNNSKLLQYRVFYQKRAFFPSSVLTLQVIASLKLSIIPSHSYLEYFAEDLLFTNSTHMIILLTISATKFYILKMFRLLVPPREE